MWHVALLLLLKKTTVNTHKRKFAANRILKVSFLFSCNNVFSCPSTLSEHQSSSPAFFISFRWRNRPLRKWGRASEITAHFITKQTPAPNQLQELRASPLFSTTSGPLTSAVVPSPRLLYSCTLACLYFVSLIASPSSFTLLYSPDDDDDDNSPTTRLLESLPAGCSHSLSSTKLNHLVGSPAFTILFKHCFHHHIHSFSPPQTITTLYEVCSISSHIRE